MRQKQALQVMLEGKSVFLTGPPGAGKTFVLKEFIARSRNRGKTIAVTASTGIAATHIGGSTIHSWSGLGIKDYITYQEAKIIAGKTKLNKRFNSTDILVIDEVSMLHGARLDMADMLLKLARQNDKPFGGLQIIVVGDLFQLPPVNRNADSDFAHLSKSWKDLNPLVCYLSEQHRQDSGELLDLLLAMRNQNLRNRHITLLQSRLNEAEPEKTITKLYTHNIDVDRINQTELSKLETELLNYTASVTGSKKYREQLAAGLLTPLELDLKIGAEVIFTVNDTNGRFANGTQGMIVDTNDEDWPIVKLHSNSRKITVTPYSWKLQDGDKIRAEVSQIPLRLAWAITIHKSQGMTLDAAIIDLSKAFTPGMGYVALSRLKSIDGLHLRGINRQALMLHDAIHEVDEHFRSTSDELAITTEDAADESSNAKPLIIENTELMNDLKLWRTKTAKSRSLPPYVIAHDKVLLAISNKIPQTEQELLRIDGIGTKKIDTYGKDILAITSRYANI
ncbi:MAG: AAA family ATPase [bacterium]|nr:AAA family ATPase [bacterium]